MGRAWSVFRTLSVTARLKGRALSPIAMCE